MPKFVARLTGTYVESLKPAGNKPRDVGDPAMRGLLIRIWPWGTKNWLFRYAWNKTPVRISLGNFPDRSVQEAHELALEYRKFYKQGDRSAPPIAPSWSVTEGQSEPWPDAERGR